MANAKGPFQKLAKDRLLQKLTAPEAVEDAPSFTRAQLEYLEAVFPEPTSITLAGDDAAIMKAIYKAQGRSTVITHIRSLVESKS